MYVGDTHRASIRSRAEANANFEECVDKCAKMRANQKNKQTSKENGKDGSHMGAEREQSASKGRENGAQALHAASGIFALQSTPQKESRNNGSRNRNEKPTERGNWEDTHGNASFVPNDACSFLMKKRMAILVQSSRRTQDNSVGQHQTHSGERGRRLWSISD